MSRFKSLLRTNRSGFTVLELLIVLAVVGLMAAFILPRIGDTKTEAYVAAMRNDLRNYVTSQEIYVQDQDRYAGAPSADGLAYTFSPNVLPVSSKADQQTYELIVGHEKTDVRCMVRGQIDRVITGCGNGSSITADATGLSVDFSLEEGGGNLAGNFDVDDMILNAVANPLYAAASGEITWDFGDGATLEGPASTHRTVNHIYRVEGTYTVVVEENLDDQKPRLVSTEVTVSRPDLQMSVEHGRRDDSGFDTSGKKIREDAVGHGLDRVQNADPRPMDGEGVTVYAVPEVLGAEDVVSLHLWDLEVPIGTVVVDDFSTDASPITWAIVDGTASNLLRLQAETKFGGVDTVEVVIDDMLPLDTPFTCRNRSAPSPEDPIKEGDEVVCGQWRRSIGVDAEVRLPGETEFVDAGAELSPTLMGHGVLWFSTIDKPAGTYEIRFTRSNNFGRSGMPPTVTFDVEEITVSADFTWSPTSPVEGETVTFDASSSTTNARDGVTYSWELISPSGASDTEFRSEPTLAWTAGSSDAIAGSETGDWTVRLTVEQTTIGTSDTIEKTVTVSEP